METFLLDTSALFTLRYDEPGAAEVQSVLSESRAGRVVCLISFISSMEYLYSVWRQEGKEVALKAYLQLKSLPFERVDTSESLILLAGEIKATHSLSLADSWVAATALEKKATLVHKDPEFEPLKGRISLKALPYKF